MSRSPCLALACGRPHFRPSGHWTRSHALPAIRGTAPRRRIATRRERPPLPRPSSPPPRPGPRRSWAPSSRRGRQRRPGGRAVRATPRPRKTRRRPPPSAQTPPPCPRQSAPTAAPARSVLARHPTRSAVFTKAPGIAESRKARRSRPGLQARAPLPCSRPPGA